MVRQTLKALTVAGAFVLLTASCAGDDPIDVAVAGEVEDATAVHGHDSDHNDGAVADVDLVVEVIMSEFSFDLKDLTVPVGSTVRFDFVNEGAIEHEAMFGTAHEQDEIAAQADHGDGHRNEEGHDSDVHAVTIDSGGAASLVVTFDEPGEMMIGCHIPGHYDAGMSATFTVT